MDPKGIVVHVRYWVGLTQDKDYWKAIVNTALNIKIP